jgi:hypothetical protein
MTGDAIDRNRPIPSGRWVGVEEYGFDFTPKRRQAQYRLAALFTGFTVNL